MLKTRIAIIITLIVLRGFVGFHLVERTLHGGRVPSFLEEVLFIGGLVLGVSLLVAGIFRLRLIRRVNQVSSRALEILHADNWTARLEEGSAGGDLAELSGAVNRLLEVADTSQQELRESERRLAAQSQALTELTSRQTGVSVTVSDRLRLILETCARTLEVARVSIWRFEDNGATIRCDDLYQHTTGQHSSGDRMYERDVPAYFNAIGHDRVVAASDAHADPRTREFSELYLTPHGIGAMLDVPLRQEDRALGVMCIEHVGGPAGVDVRRAELRPVARQPGGRRAGGRRPAAGRAEPRRERSPGAPRARLGARRVHRHGLRRPRSSAGTRRRRRRSAGRATRSSAGSWPTPSFRRASARRTSKGMRRFHETGDAPIVNRRLELRGLHRDGHEFPIEITVTTPGARRHAATSSARSCGTSPSGCSTRTSCARRRSPPKPRRARRASSSRT